MGLWERFFKKRTHDQTSADRHVPQNRANKAEGPDTGPTSHVVLDGQTAYGDIAPAYMRKKRTSPLHPGKSDGCAEDVSESSTNEAFHSCAPNRQVKGALSFVLPDDRQAELMALCAQLDTHRSEVIRASLEMALPVFKSHPDLYDYFRQRSRQGW